MFQNLKNITSRDNFTTGFRLKLKKNWRPKSVFLAFTVKSKCKGEIVEKEIKKQSDNTVTHVFDLEFEFSKDEKAFMKFRNQIGKFLVYHSL